MKLRPKDVEQLLNGAGLEMPKGRATPRPSKMNGTETRYAEHLEMRRRTGDILRYDFEAESLRLADNTHYHPDFRVILPDGTIEFHEVKGRKSDGSAYTREKGWIKLKIAAEQHPYKFCLVWPRPGGGWERRDV